MSVLRLKKGIKEPMFIRGHGLAIVRTDEGKIKQKIRFENLVTQIGDQYYGERAAGIASPPAQVTGMRLGLSTTAPTKTGGGAAIVSYLSGSAIALDSGFPSSSLSGSSRRITWQAVWPAGTATSNGIAEVVLTNETPLTNIAGVAANTISRALLSPVADKGAGDTLTVVWYHDLLGA